MKHITTTKKHIHPVNTNLVTAIILAAKKTKQLKTIPSLVSFKDGQTLLQKQITTLRNAVPNIEIVVVTGQSVHDLYKEHDGLNVRFVENEKVDENNSLRSLSLGLRATINPYILVLHGDVWPTVEAIHSVIQSESALLVDNSKQISNEKIGLIVDEGKISSLCYGLDSKWGQIGWFCDQELTNLKELAFDCKKNSWFLHEAISAIMNRDGSFKAIYGGVIEINSQKEIDKVNKCLK